MEAMQDVKQTKTPDLKTTKLESSCFRLTTKPLYARDIHIPERPENPDMNLQGKNSLEQMCRTTEYVHRKE